MRISLADGDGTYAEVIAKKLRMLGWHSAADHVLALDASVAILNEDRFQAETAREDVAAELRSLQAQIDDWVEKAQNWAARLAATEDFTDIVIDALEAADKELTKLRDRGHDQVRSDVIDKVRRVLDRLNHERRSDG